MLLSLSFSVFHALSLKREREGWREREKVVSMGKKVGRSLVFLFESGSAAKQGSFLVWATNGGDFPLSSPLKEERE